MAEILIPTPPDIAPDAAVSIAAEILEDIRGSAVAMLDVHQAAFKKLWHNTQVSPAEIFAALGPAGLSVLNRGGDMVGFLLGQHTGRPIASMDEAEYMPPVAYSVGQDGSVTLEPEPEEE